MILKLPRLPRNSILKAPYVGFINLDMPTFGDIAVLAKGKLKKNADKTFSFEQINDRCDEKCQINADKYLENVTALWMVERIRHRDESGTSHRYDLKFTIVPIYNDQKHQVDHNILENRLRNHMKRTFILRDSDYPNYFQPNLNRRTDLFSNGFERSISSFMNIDPSSLMQNLLGINLSPGQKVKPIDHRLNKGEFYHMTPKIQNSRTHFHPTINEHADHHVRFPDSREMTISRPPMNLYRPQPEIYKPNSIDYRGANDNVYVGSSDHQQMHQPIAVPVYSIPVDMPIIQIAQTPGYYQSAFPFQIQLSTPANQPLYPQHDITTFRYHQPQLIGLSNQPTTPLFNPYVPLNLVPSSNKSKPFHESERHTMNYYSQLDPVYHHHHQQSTTEAPIQPSTYSPRFNNYASVLRPQLETPVMSTASSIQVNTFDDIDFQPITPSYDVRKFSHVKSAPRGTSTARPQSHDNSPSYATLPPPKVTSDKVNEVSYTVVAERPKSPSQKFFIEKPSEKPVLKWVPKKQRNKLNVTSTAATTTPVAQQPFVPTIIPIETTTEPATKSTTHIFRGRNRFNRRNSSSSGNVRGSVSPTKIVRKKTTSMASSSSVASTLSPFTTMPTVFPTYITPPVTDEPITSLSTSISLEVNGERIFDATTTAGYELISAGVESIDTNTTNVKLFKASVVPESFDNLTFSILNHAKALETDKDEH